MKNKYTHKLTIMVILAISIGCSTTAVAQDKKQITGTVSDNTGPLLGASILIKNTSQGTSTDIDGTYSIQATPSDTLVFSYLGLLPQEIPVNLQTRIDVILNTDETSLDEVVINAGYYKVSERERTGSISKITAEKIEKQSVLNPIEALQGQIPGMNISTTTGLPGGGTKIRIRGQNSIAAGNEPLFVIDGVPYDTQSLGEGFASTSILADDNGSPLNNISPSEIESIEVLKDADATAIYGSRGANGVILITTKEGESGKTKVSFQSQAAFGSVTRYRKLLNTPQYIRMREEAMTNDGFDSYPDYAYDINGTWDREKYTDWQKELIGNTAYRNSIYGSISGGDKYLRFLLNGDHTTETTVYPGDFKYNRNSLHSSLNYVSKNDKFNLKFSTHFGVENNKLPPRDVTLDAITLPPNAPDLYMETGELNWENGTFENPISYFNGLYTLKRSSLLGNISFRYELIPSLKFTFNSGFEKFISDESRTHPNTIYNPDYGLGTQYSAIFVNKAERSSWILEPQLEWSTSILDGTLTTLVGASIQQKNSSVLSYLGQDFASNDLIHDLSAASYLFIEQDQEILYKYQATYGRLNYNWNKKYIINFTGRRDGSSRFGPGKKISNFGAIGIAWIFSEEKFLSKIGILNFGKLRASYGKTGNDQIQDYGYLNTYSVTGITYGNVKTIQPTQLFNPEFGWELNRKISTALEVNLLKNFNLSTEWYNNRSKNQLVKTPLPWTTGFSSIQSNLNAIVENTGWEISLNSQNIQGDTFSWNSSFNLTLPQNKLISFPGISESTYKNIYEVGQPITVVKVFKYTGVNPETGLFEFKDYNGDGIINAPDDQQLIIDLGPKLYGGLHNNLEFKNWNLDFLIQFSKQKAYNQWLTSGLAGSMSNQPIDVLNHWEESGDNTSYQIYSSGMNTNASRAFSNFIRSDAAISDASYIRLKNISLSYSIYQKDYKAKIFAQAQNLITMTRFKGGDPEEMGGFLPQLKWIGAGCQITF